MCSSASAAARKISRRICGSVLPLITMRGTSARLPDQRGRLLDHPPAHAAAADEGAVDVPEDQSSHAGAPGRLDGEAALLAPLERGDELVLGVAAPPHPLEERVVVVRDPPVLDPVAVLVGVDDEVGRPGGRR